MGVQGVQIVVLWACRGEGVGSMMISYDIVHPPPPSLHAFLPSFSGCSFSLPCYIRVPSGCYGVRHNTTYFKALFRFDTPCERTDVLALERLLLSIHHDAVLSHAACLFLCMVLRGNLCLFTPENEASLECILVFSFAIPSAQYTASSLILCPAMTGSSSFFVLLKQVTFASLDRATATCRLGI